MTCESEERDPGSKFQISVAEDGSGRWALRNVTRGYFLGSSSDKLQCTAKVPGDAELWHVHLAARPQVNLRSVGRKRFAHLSDNLDEIHVDANIPWGEDTLFTLEFRQDDGGKYALHTCNNKYLASNGKLVETCGNECVFTAEYHGGQLALRDRSGAYLSPIGSKAVLKTRSNTVTKDELFSLEDSLPQASFVAALNSKYVSVKQGQLFLSFIFICVRRTLFPVVSQRLGFRLYIVSKQASRRRSRICCARVSGNSEAGLEPDLAYGSAGIGCGLGLGLGLGLAAPLRAARGCRSEPTSHSPQPTAHSLQPIDLGPGPSVPCHAMPYPNRTPNHAHLPESRSRTTTLD